MAPDLTAIAGRFFPGRPIDELRPYGGGHINDTFRVRLAGEGAPGEAYLLQRLNHEVFRQPEQVMHNVRVVYEHLSALAGAGCLLRPIPGADGQLLVRDDRGGYWRMFPFYDHTFSPERAADPGQARRAAGAIGRFLARLATLDPARLYPAIPGFHDSLRRLRHFRRAVSRDEAGRLAAARAEVDAVFEHHDLFETVARLPLPQRVVHNDAKLSNVLFHENSGEPCGVVDWDTIMPGILLSDFGDLVRSAAATAGEDEADPSRIGLDASIFAALCQGFIPEIRAIATPAEQANLFLGPAWITLEQTMRFLTDHLEGDRYYKIRYPGHNLVRTRNQLALFRDMRRMETEIQDAIRAFFSE